ncbi:MAG: hypothetical protein KBA33_08250 [Cloacibacterium sp.]|nr:hypothetical protein [Cloacibacterium sp.]
MQETIKIAPLYSYADIEKKSFKTLDFQGDWLNLIGTPEVAGCWVIWGLSGQGKTRFALQLAKYLSGFEKVYYNTLEEGVKLSFRNALKDNNMKAAGSKFGFQSEDLETMKIRLRKDRSPNIVIVDSLQYLNAERQDIDTLLEEFPKKLFIFISHAKGSEPKGDLADRVKYHADVKIRVHQFVASPVESTRYGGNEPYIIWEEGMRKAQLKLT